MSSSELLKIEDLTKKREKGGATFILEVPNFQVNSGEFVGIIGPSGCGKSTFLDMLALILKVDSAKRFELYADSKKPINLAKLNDARLATIRKRYIGYILQSGGLLPFLTVRENILLSGRLNGVDIPNRHFFELMERLGISGEVDKKPQYLSGGQRQRVAIARAIIDKPLLILADEPTASVDRPTALEIRDQFKTLAKENNLTLLMVTHDTEMVEGHSDRIFEFDLQKSGKNSTISRVVER
ncbi:ABC transporter, ATP-binding protein [hydrothermal vent metagenome]|uniref:ABC transporter, ATP-binding protein n=1 Tax=hydrothermal vent metagenome TaxID=652676 RepID=A0A1W1CD91_9ZZZZ